MRPIGTAGRLVQPGYPRLDGTPATLTGYDRSSELEAARRSCINGTARHLVQHGSYERITLSGGGTEVRDVPLERFATNYDARTM